MKKLKAPMILWPLVIGFAMMGLRLSQNRTGFDPDTGLAVTSGGGILLVVGIILSAAALGGAEWLLGRGEGRRRPSLVGHFAPPEKAMPVLVAGCLLLAVGGGAAVAEYVSTGEQVVLAVAGALAVASGAGLLVLVRQLNAQAADSVGPILPAMFFAVFFVLAVYLPSASDPVLPRFYLRVLAAALDAYAFSLLAGFLRRETSPRLFELTAIMALVTSIAAMADEGWPNRLLFAGCACLLAGFLHLQRPEDLPEPEPKEEPAEGGERASE